MAKFDVRIFTRAKEYIDTLPGEDQGTIAADITAMGSGDFDAVSTKQLKGPIREMITGYHRLVYFRLNQVLCFVSGFRKKTPKTPKKEIDYAEKIYKVVKNHIQE